MLVAGLYWMVEELQDILLQGPGLYFVQSGWLNMLDWANVLGCLFMEVSFYVYRGMTPGDGAEHTWSLAQAQAWYQIAAGISLSWLCSGFSSIRRTFQ